MPYQTTPAQQSTPKQLAQSRPANTSNATIYSPADGVVTEITLILVCETAGTGAAFRIFHDDGGAVNDQRSALYYDVAVAANTTAEIDVGIYMNGPDGSMVVRTDTGNALTFTLYGLETQTRAR